MKETKLEEWHFDFGLCAPDPSQPIPESRCDELMDVIIDWAEKNDLSIGGGFREFLDED